MANTGDWRQTNEGMPGVGTFPLGFCFRSDLRVLRESVGDGSTMNVRVIDPVNGKHYRFNEAEFFLCEAANGQATAQAILDEYQERFGQAMTLRELRSFYRRLKIFGLTERLSDDADAFVESSDESLGRRGGPGRAAWDSGWPRRASGAGRAFGNFGPDQEPGPLLRALMRARAGDGGGMARPAGTAKRGPLWLFAPQALFAALYILLFPVKYLYWLLWPGLALAGLTVFHRWDDFAVSASRVFNSPSSITIALIGLLTVNLFSRLAQGMVVSRCCGRAPRLGVTLVFGFVPRFVVDLAGVRRLDSRDQARIYAAPLLARLAIFIAGVFAWAVYRHTGSALADGALLIGLIGLGAFALTASPLLPGEGLKWLSVRLGEPQLKAKAIAALTGRRTAAERRDGLDTSALALFGGAIVLSTALFVLAMLVSAAVALETRLQGPGVALFLGMLAAFLVWLLALRVKTRQLAHRRERTALIPGRTLGATGGAAQQRPAQGPMAATAATAAPRRGGEPDAHAEALTPARSAVARLFWAVLLVAALSVAFLPYEYETGGSFRVLPSDQHAVAVRTDGEVTAVFVREGDWVEAGQVLAQLSAWDEERDLAVTRAELEKAQANLDDLEARPKPEQIALAQRQVESVRSVVAFSKAELDRADYLHRSGSGSLQALEKARTTLDQNVANLNVAIANLDLIKSGATAAELDAARAEVRRLAHTLDYRRDQLERTRVRAPTAGRVITPNAHLLTGKYLTNGQPFLELEDTRVVQVEIEVPETDLSLVEIGDDVRIRAWSYTDRIIAGAVTGIAPAVDVREFGSVVRVNADIPNDEGELKSGMTGYAKIAGGEMPVWRAYLSLFVRFFDVEVWSWIP
ncbi:MAG: efflux RND transporter periplasmic adaptor subunit [Rhodospirillales bacterium]|nr:efflux RND transporter periplasmic adaptor subunit [Rhodospirillales bacterium]